MSQCTAPIGVRQSFLDSLPIKPLDPNSAALCEGLLTPNECTFALFSMSYENFPGSDGLLVEFYQHFWPPIGTLVVNSLNYGFQRATLSFNKQEASKKRHTGKDVSLLTNLRLITLLKL